MLRRLSVRFLAWCLLAALPAGAAAASATRLPSDRLGALAPWLSALALAVALIGWRLLHREVQGRLHDDSVVRDQMRRLHEAMHASVDGLFLLRAVRTTQGVLEDFEITDVNRSGAALLYRAPEALVGCRLRRDIGGPIGDALYARYAWALTTGTPVVEEQRVSRRLLAAGWVLHQAMPTSDGLAVTARDISDRKRVELALRRASLTDDLTGLYNRRGFMALAEQQLRVARRSGKDTVVMYADMDGFKQLNDDYGHATGDRALIMVARLLRETVRDCDVVARLGGDEFTILACEADGSGARVIQRRIEERLAVMNASGELPAPLALTIGYTRVRPTDTAAVAELLARADQLLYARKRRRQVAGAVRAQAPRAAVARTGRRTPAVPPMVVPADVAAVARATVRHLPTSVGTTATRPAPAVPAPGVPS
ncbi:MAG: GGDEF domain-containing protein [Gemmatimonadetes bacterium]|nr:GGDEF domain-containing protein [Gemmatimonadota bacterium]